MSVRDYPHSINQRRKTSSLQVASFSKQGILGNVKRGESWLKTGMHAFIVACFLNAGGYDVTRWFNLPLLDSLP